MRTQYWLKQGGQLRPAAARFATNEDLKRLQEWSAVSKPETSPLDAKDAAQYAIEALERLTRLREKKLAASSVTEAYALIEANPTQEVAMLLVLDAPWWTAGRPACFAYLRRTWCGNLYLEYLSKHPVAVATPELGFGKAMEATLAWVGEVASEIKASWVWWETTDRSEKKYVELVGARNLLHSDVRDLIVVRPATLRNLAVDPA